MWHLKLLAAMKYLASYFRSDWTLDDYPIRVRKQEDNLQSIGRFKPVLWDAQIVNWWQLTGSGDTKDEAIANLNEHFNEYKRRHKTVPRPGTLVPIQFAPTNEIAKYTTIARDFFEKILEMDFDTCFISDRSSLWDFPTTEDEARVFELIEHIYKVDVSDIRTGNLAQIFKRLHDHSQTSLHPSR
jgi:hypothetical protein